MAESHCATCGQPLAACACPPPPLPDTTARIVQLQADRARVCGWLGSQPGQHHPTIRAWVDAELARARDADEATIQAMLAQYKILPRRRHGTGHYPMPHLFYHDVAPIIQHYYGKERKHPSADTVAAALPTPLSTRQLQRLVKQLYGMTWETFLRTFFGLRG